MSMLLKIKTNDTLWLMNTVVFQIPANG